MFAKKVKSQVKAHFFDQNKAILVTGFLPAFKVICDIINVHEVAAMWVLLHYYDKKTNTNALNTFRCAKKMVMTVWSLRTQQRAKVCYLLRFRLEVIKYMLMKYAADEDNAVNDARIRWSFQPPNKTLRQYKDDLDFKSCQVDDVYNKSTPIRFSIEGVDGAIRNRLPNYWAKR